MSTRSGWGALPADCSREVFKYLPARDLCIAGRVCKNWTVPSADPKLWYLLVCSQTEFGTAVAARAAMASAESKRAAIEALAPNALPAPVPASSAGSAGAAASAAALASAGAAPLPAAAARRNSSSAGSGGSGGSGSAVSVAAPAPLPHVNWREVYAGRESAFAAVHRSRGSWRAVLGVSGVLGAVLLCVTALVLWHDLGLRHALLARAVRVPATILSADLTTRVEPDSDGGTYTVWEPRIAYAFHWPPADRADAARVRYTGDNLYPVHVPLLYASGDVDSDEAHEVVAFARRLDVPHRVWVDPASVADHQGHYLVEPSLVLPLILSAVLALLAVLFTHCLASRTSGTAPAAVSGHRVFVAGVDRGLRPVQLRPVAVKPQDAAAGAAAAGAGNNAPAPAAAAGAGAAPGGGAADGGAGGAGAADARAEPPTISDWLLPLIDSLEVDLSKQTLLYAVCAWFVGLSTLLPLVLSLVSGQESTYPYALWWLMLVDSVVLLFPLYAWRAKRRLSHHFHDASVYAPARTYLCRDRPNTVVLQQYVAHACDITRMALVVECFEVRLTRNARNEDVEETRRVHAATIDVVGGQAHAEPLHLTKGQALTASCTVAFPAGAHLTTVGDGAGGPYPKHFWALTVRTHAVQLPVYTRRLTIELRASAA